MILLLLAGSNMAVFHLVGARGISNGTRAEKTPVAAKAAGIISLVIWVALVACGRWIGFTLH